MNQTSTGPTGDPAEGFMTDFVSVFAGVLLLMSAAFGILQGASAIANDDLYSAGSDYLYKFDMDVWGWTHVVIGVLCVVVAIGILRGSSWGQISGIIIAGLSAIANFAFIPHYPLWAITVIAVDLLIIHALAIQLKRG
jgi:hypothetical protein